MIGTVARLAFVVVAGALATTLAAGAGARAQELTRSQLAIVVIPKAALGGGAASLESGLGSGFADNAEAADDSLDPADTASDLAKAGRLIGYDLHYSDVSFRALTQGRGLLEIGTSVDLFKSAEAADRYLTKTLNDYARFQGKSVGFAITLATSTRFSVSRLGDRAICLRATLLFGDEPVHITVVAFRTGSLLAAAALERADDKPVEAEVERLAGALQRRIRQAAAGKLRGQAVAVPSTSRAGRRPAGAPDLAAMALRLADLSAGAVVSREGYVRDTNTLATYERQFSGAPLRAGGSVALGLENDLSLFRTGREAGGFLLLLRTVYASKTISQQLQQAFSKGAGVAVRGTWVEQNRRVAAGEEAFAVSARFTAASVGFRALFLYVRVDRVVASLIVTGRANSLKAADGIVLTRAVASHIRAVL